MAMYSASPSRAAELIAQIRHHAGINQTELARRTGLTRSVLSAYERGHRQPSVAALERIAAAADLELQVVPRGEDAELTRAGEILEQVLELAELLPSRQRGELTYPPLSRFAA
jgi:transcriptional regulator with XRE-family HTH domain